MLCFPTTIDLGGLRKVVAVLSVNMLLQAILVGCQVAASTDKKHLAEQTLYRYLVLSHLAWVAVSGVGGLAGLFAVWKLNVHAAQLCLTSWLVLMALQCFQFLAMTLLFDEDAAVAVLAESLLLVAIETCFIGLVYSFIHKLSNAPSAMNQVDESGIDLVEMHAAKPVTQYGSIA
ncbi:unnamed protein product [Aphanomyces euteiches]|uniref:Uncharacterized protein n=1 Tax=Aphanomyces euteiches TaxID=100861 RepID=A0A6G0X5R9_9STRA|nr:hypothetical protein Ae201684_008228 [Aphanomyces euteiches]KAH9070154.1 hypothetical protein Ae201684P_002524 [Aphanomyces euteiches]KAH9142980.1 hypothetical protein AeRB84_012985 [Aphanomyces euteiches]